MKKSLLLRLCCVASALFIALACAGCGGGKKKDNSGKPDVPAGDIKFPLEEPVTFTFMIDRVQETDTADKLAQNKVWQRWKEETNVNIEFQYLGQQSDAAAQFALMANAKSYGDVLSGGPYLNSITAMNYYDQGIIAPMTSYVNKDYMPNFFERVVPEVPDIIKGMAAPDGEVICLPYYDKLAGNLESPIWINEKWLKKLNLEVPATVAEFENVLKHFKDDDPNGNGQKDEIPLLIVEKTNWSTFESWLGMFGIATKSGVNDAYTTIKNGKVSFAATTDAYKDALKWFRSLYQNGLIYTEAMTADTEDFYAKVDSATSIVGVYTHPYRDTGDPNKGDYICINPPKAENYDPCWYIHPGSITGTLNTFFITDKCENVGVLMKWIDRLYSFENSVALQYNEVGDGRIEKTDDGKIKVLEVDPVALGLLDEEKPNLMYQLVNIRTYAVTADDLANRYEIGSTYYTDRLNAYEQYSKAGVINKEIWPRPYMASESSTTIGDISSDLFTEVSEFLANAVVKTGFDIDKEWSGYIKRCEDLQLADFENALQKAYDAYLGK